MATSSVQCLMCKDAQNVPHTDILELDQAKTRHLEFYSIFLELA